ncbi:GNAT family N-acetyltransferase [Mucilaginibacter psychrotolerans]|uniref:N-acetyltransferase n=1 Tax=Mucilaginibacter psychrotolerans TaxID=1524096 RepID=A0A4Y8S513_9SPHI|nr:GNAT family protein [Mucilaginibacter psychrotolerans]TFF34038.1 N-acetyltransferase [Mucilaginibacter psychrotolerans]
MEIKGSNFTLRNWRESDAADLQRLADNPNIAANLYDRFPSPYTFADAEWFIGQKIDEQPATSLVIEVDGAFAGTIGIEFRGDVFSKSPLFGYWLGEPYWDRSIMTEAARLVTRYAFATFDIICLQAGVFGSNPASMRVLEKAGFEKQGILKGTVYKLGQILDEHIYVSYRPVINYL